MHEPSNEMPKLPKNFEEKLKQRIKQDLVLKNTIDAVLKTIPRLFILFLDMISIITKPESKQERSQK